MCFKGGAYMKKALSLFLAVLMILSACAVSFGAFAEDKVDMGACTCKDCTRIMNGCHCCAACPYLDETYLLSCAKDKNGHFSGSFCCAQCDGIWPCDCNCSCCQNKDAETDDQGRPILTPQQQKDFIKGFQSVLKKVADVFDMIFDAIFKFLRIDDWIKIKK